MVLAVRCRLKTAFYFIQGGHVSERNRPPVLFILTASVIIGVIIVFGYLPLYGIIQDFITPRLKPAGSRELAALIAMGVVIGAVVYFFAVFIAEAVTGRIFKYLLSSLQKKQILPYSFKAKRRGGFVNIYRDINRMLDLFINTFMELKEDKDKFSKAVEMHLDPTVKEHLDGGRIDDMYLVSRKKTATVLFTDIRGFTSFTETHEAEDVIRVLNEYFTETTKIIDKHKGKVNKYIGDAVMAVFEEAPKYKDYLDCDQAIIAALDIQTKFRILAKKWQDKIDPSVSIGLGIGLARGEVTAGTVGSEERMEYTVIGDTVNLASRLCAKAKDGQVIISDDIYGLVSKFTEVEALPPVEIKGKTGMYAMYSVITRKMVI